MGLGDKFSLLRHADGNSIFTQNQQQIEMLRKKRLCLKILFKLLRIYMQTTYFFMNNSILLTEFFSYFHISQSWRIRKKRRLFCIKFLITSWLCLVLAMCWEKLCGCTILSIMKHWWKMPPNIFLYSYLDSQWLCISIMWNIFLWWKKGGQGGYEPSNWKKNKKRKILKKKRMNIWLEKEKKRRTGARGRAREGLSLLNFILMKWNFVTYCS